MRNGNTLLGTTVTSGNVIGAGGYVTGLQTAADGTLIGRLDTGSPVVLAPGATAWVKQLQPSVDLQISDMDLTQGDPSTYAAAIAWSNSAIRYTTFMGWVWVKKSGATYYTKTTLARRTTINGDGSSRGGGEPLVVDPANPAVCIFIAPEGGFITTDYGDNWTALSGIPAPSAGIRGCVAYDRSSAVTGSRTQRIYIFIPGSGMYRSTDGGSTWAAMTAMPGQPTSAAHVNVSPLTGTVLVTGLNTTDDGPVRRWNGTAWSTSTRNDGGGTKSIKAVAFSTTANRVYGIGIAGDYAVSVDDGAVWTAGSPNKVNTSVDVPWQSSDTGYKTVGGIVERPSDSLPYISTGVGVWKLLTPPLVYADTVSWTGISLGIENMVGTCVNYAPDGACSVTMQDKQSMMFTPRKPGRAFSNDYGPYRGSILRGNNSDYAPEDTNFWVTTVVDNDIGFTTDLGKTWTPRTSLRSTSGNTHGGGQVVVLSKDVWICGQLAGAPFDSTTRAQNTLYITRDRGVTWTELVLGNGNAICAQLTFFNGSARHVFAKDIFYTAAGLLGRVYFYNCADIDNPSTTDALACRGVWQIDVPVANTAPTVTRKYNGRLGSINQDGIHNKLVMLGAAGKLAFVGGDGMPLAYRSNDSGVTWVEFSGTDDQSAGTKFAEVFGVSAGKKRFDSTYPTLYAVGFRDTGNNHATGTTAELARYGTWASYDDGATWKRIAQFPGGSPIRASDLGASPAVFGEVTITLGGMGAATLYYSSKTRTS